MQHISLLVLLVVLSVLFFLPCHCDVIVGTNSLCACVCLCASVQIWRAAGALLSPTGRGVSWPGLEAAVHPLGEEVRFVSTWKK